MVMIGLVRRTSTVFTDGYSSTHQTAAVARHHAAAVARHHAAAVARHHAGAGGNNSGLEIRRRQ